MIFDLDGTLLDTIGDLASAGNHALRAMGLAEHSVEEYKKMVGNGIPKLIERMLPEGLRGQAVRAVAMSLFLKRYGEHKFDTTARIPASRRYWRGWSVWAWPRPSSRTRTTRS